MMTSWDVSSASVVKDTDTKLDQEKARMFHQSAAIPYLTTDNGIQIVLVTSSKRTGWIYPKGIVEPNMTPQESAAQEAYEEAGVAGTIGDDLLNTYWYEKWGGDCRVEVFPLEVTEVLEDWDERRGFASGLLLTWRQR